MGWLTYRPRWIVPVVFTVAVGTGAAWAEQPGLPPGGGHGPAMRQGGYHEPGVVQRDLADRIAHVGRMLGELAPILLAEGRLPREVLGRLREKAGMGERG